MLDLYTDIHTRPPPGESGFITIIAAAALVIISKTTISTNAAVDMQMTIMTMTMMAPGRKVADITSTSAISPPF
jgi:hypothetical protein